jgi:Na+/H+ antiporter NhaC
MSTTGLAAARAEGLALQFGEVDATWSSIKTILGKADSNYALLYASLSAAVLAILLAVIPRTLSLAKAMEAAVAGMAHMFAACIILVLAWGLAKASDDLQLGIVARDFLQKRIEAGTFSLQLLPLSVFVTACIISFATGTAWGTMALLCGPVVGIAAGLLTSLPADQALPLFYATVGGVMGGAVFGNTCSPLADVTVLSSIFSACDLSAHVRTILPYALVVAVVSVLSLDGLRYGLQRWSPELYPQWNIYWSLAVGAILLLLMLLAIGRRVPEEPAISLHRPILPSPN